ncbi:MAG: glycosyltransferase family A protein, partial [Nanoarchaeota archaeon]|nr:glycosyltransferase family A protein [Nanoarchaeota archaeon]
MTKYPEINIFKISQKKEKFLRWLLEHLPQAKDKCVKGFGENAYKGQSLSDSKDWFPNDVAYMENTRVTGKIVIDLTQVIIKLIKNNHDLHDHLSELGPDFSKVFLRENNVLSMTLRVLVEILHVQVQRGLEISLLDLTLRNESSITGVAWPPPNLKLVNQQDIVQNLNNLFHSLIEILTWERNFFNRIIGQFPMVSIIMPVYNFGTLKDKTGETFLEQGVKSALNQDYPKNRYEIVIVDDGSTDNSWSIIKKLASKNKTIRAFKKKNGGSASALNHALDRIPDANLICYFDPDDLLPKDSIRIRAVFLMKHPEIRLVHAKSRSFDKDGFLDERGIVSWFEKEYTTLNGRPDRRVTYDDLFEKNYFHGGTVMVHKSTLGR